jgi:drug/metabolite transporter (DMT)-like permease
MAYVLAFLSSIAFGAGDFAGGFASRRSPVAAVLVWSQLIGLACALAAAPLLAQAPPRPTDLAWGAAAGLAGAWGLTLLYRALATTVAAVASPAAAAVGAVVPVLFGLASGERPRPLAWAGVGLALAAIVLLTAGPPGERPGTARRALALGIGAGAGFGLFFVAISRPAETAGLYPLVAARVASIAAVAGVTLARRRPLGLVRGDLLPAAAAGVLDMTANALFVAATRGALLALVTVLTSLYPAPTVLLAWGVLKQRPSALRLAGLAAAVAAVALVGMA